MYFENAEVLHFLDFCIIHNEEIYIEVFILCIGMPTQKIDTFKQVQRYKQIIPAPNLKVNKIFVDCFGEDV